MKRRREEKAKPHPRPAPLAGDRFVRIDSLFLAAATALVVATPIIPSEATVFFGTAAPLDLLWTLLLVGWTLAAWLRPDPRVRLGWTAVAAALLIGWHTLSALTSGLEGNARQALNMLWQWTSYGLAAFLLRQLLTTPLACRALVAVMIALAASESAHAGYEYFVSKPAQLAEFQRDPEGAYRDSNLTTQAQQDQLRWRIEAVEPLGTFGLTNSLAGLIAPWLIALLGIALTSFRRSDLRLATAGGLAIALLIAGCLLLTKSRTAILATAGGIVLLALYGRASGWQIGWKIPVIAAGALLVLLLVVVFVGGLDVPVLSEAPLSVRYRIEYWRATTAMIAEHPLLGCGPGQFQEAYARYKLPQASETVADPHNFLLEVWSTAGTPAVLALLAMAGALVWQVSRAESVGHATTDRHGRGSLQANEAGAFHERLWLYGGAFIGVLIAFPLGLVVGYPPPLWSDALPLPVIWLIGLPMGITALWLLDDWVRQGEMPTSLPIIALVVLLVNLLAAGSTGFPGVFGSAWVLLVVALASSNARIWNRSLSKPAVLGLLAAALLLMFTCLQTEFSPVVAAAGKQAVAESLLQSGRTDQAEVEFLAAAEADPWSPHPWRKIAELRLRKYVATGHADEYARFSEAMLEFRRRDPRHYSTCENCGHWLLLAWRKESEPARLAAALHEYEQAVAWYPARALGHAQLAWALHLAGRPREAAAEAETALKLDVQIPHAELKLDRQKIYDPQPGEDSFVSERPESAELTMQSLRKATQESRS